MPVWSTGSTPWRRRSATRPGRAVTSKPSRSAAILAGTALASGAISLSSIALDKPLQRSNAQGVRDGGLDGSACKNQTTTPPAGAAHSPSRARTMRACICEKLSPPGKRNLDGLSWMICHCGSRARAAGRAPVHSSKSHSVSPASSRTGSPVLSAAAAAVSRARSHGGG